MRLCKIATLAPLALLTACGPESMMAPGGPAGHNLANLGWFVFILFLVIAFIMWVLLAWAALRKRGSFDEHAPIDVGGGQPWILIGGFGIPFIVLAAVYVVGLNSMAAFPLEGPRETAPADIRVTGHQWWWQIDYMKGPLDHHVTTANEIHIPVGRPVDIDLASSDVIHSFFIPTLHGKVDLIPGQVNRIRIQADRAGTYRGQCAEYCGAQHAHMILIVVADLPAQYQAWLAGQAADAPQPATDQERQGRDLFMSKACVLCHTIRGTLAAARVGPDLTHIASRQGLAANMLRNNEANLEAWVTHAQSLKPEVAMPDVTEFKGDELRALVAYLEELK
ncbi:MAG TPA: cytochrome c oxidase subunit II [Bryobacteraceae bacterium]|nr:cytochrome c oxidase subunit II [Bryobacteraceae bacterium]